MRLLACVAEHADDLVPVAVGVGVDVALGGLDCADVLSPGRTGDALVHERKRGLLRQHCLAGSAQAGDPGQQRQCGRAALVRGIADQSLADELLDLGPAACVAGGVAALLAPPGPEELADHQLGVQGAAHREQLTGGAQHLGE